MAFNFGQFAQGAGGGASLGAAGGPIGAGIGGLLGGLAGGFGSSGGDPGSIETKFFQRPTFDFVDRILPQQAQFLEGNLARLSSGNPTSQQFQNLEPFIRESRQRELGERFFGREGERGGSLTDLAQSADAQRGIGGKAGSANITSTLRDFSRERKMIEEFIESLRFADVENERNRISTDINALDRGPGGEFRDIISGGTEGFNLGSLIGGVGAQFGSNPFDLLKKGGGGGGLFSNPSISSGSVGGSGGLGNLFANTTGRGSQTTQFGGSSLDLGNFLGSDVLSQGSIGGIGANFGQFGF